jgi:hypothetical protein
MAKLHHAHPHEAWRYWPVIKEGLQKSLDASHNERGAEEVMGMLGDGRWHLFMVYNDEGEYQGFTMVEPLHTQKGTWLNIPFGYSEGSYDSVKAIFAHIEEEAKRQGCLGVKIISSRKGYERWANRLGYKKRYVEYVKEV